MIEDSVIENLGKRILAEWKRSAENRIPPGPGLLLCSPVVPEPGFESCYGESDELFLRMRVRTAPSCLELDGMSVVEARSRDLPLESHAFAMVVLTHLVSNGAEAEFREACRLLLPGGVLLVLGLNRYGLRYLGDRSGDIPGLRPLAVRKRLEQSGMHTRAMLAAGFLKREGPKNMNKGLARALVPLADTLLIVARKNEPALTTPVRRGQLRTASASSAVAGS